MDRPITRVRAGSTDPPAEPAEPGEVSLRMRVRVLLTAAFGPLVTVYAAVAALFALVSAIATHAQFSAVATLLAAGPGLLAVYQVPVELGGHPLGVLPLLPTLGACFLVSRGALGAAQRLGYREPGQAVTIIGVITGAHALIGAVVALLSGGAPFGAAPLAALLVPGVLAGFSALIGLAGRCGITSGVRRYLAPVALHGIRAGGLGMAALVTAGAATYLISLLMSLSTVHELFAAGAPGIGGGLGMLLLSVCYVPNAVVAGMGFVAGPGFSIGALSVSPFGYTGGPMPGIPLLAGVPESYAPWWPVLLLLAIATGALVGWSVRGSSEHAFTRLRAVAVAAACVALGTVLLATLAGGRLGVGPLDPVEVPAGLLSLAVFGWLAVPGGVVAWFAGPHPPLRSANVAASDEDAAADDPDAEEAADGTEADDAEDADDAEEAEEDVEEDADAEDADAEEDTEDSDVHEEEDEGEDEVAELAADGSVDDAADDAADDGNRAERP